MEPQEYVIVQTESGDWYLVEVEYSEQFVEDELNDEADYSKVVSFLNWPNDVIIRSYRFEEN